MAKKRATQHNGRKSSKGAFSAKHNDRNYDYETAPNIDASKTDTNFYWNCYDGGYRHTDREDKLTFEEVEQRFYSDYFRGQWERTNQSYIDNYHPERCKSFEDWCKMDCNLPEESYMQIGDKENPASRQDFVKVANLFNNRLNEWNQKHGYPFSNLDMSFHFDEAVPQLHIRRVWKYKDKDGTLCIGQEKALEQAGVPLPRPRKPEPPKPKKPDKDASPEEQQAYKEAMKQRKKAIQAEKRYNNRKITFDKMVREMYLECCKECGLEVETEPLKGVRHNMSKEETVNVKLAEQQKQIQADREALEADKEAFETYKQETIQQLEKQRNEASDMLKQCKELHFNMQVQSGYYCKELKAENDKKIVELDSKLLSGLEIEEQKRQQQQNFSSPKI